MPAVGMWRVGDERSESTSSRARRRGFGATLSISKGKKPSPVGRSERTTAGDGKLTQSAQTAWKSRLLPFPDLQASLRADCEAQVRNFTQQLAEMLATREGLLQIEAQLDDDEDSVAWYELEDMEAARAAQVDLRRLNSQIAEVERELAGAERKCQQALIPLLKEHQDCVQREQMSRNAPRGESNETSWLSCPSSHTDPELVALLPSCVARLEAHAKEQSTVAAGSPSAQVTQPVDLCPICGQVCVIRLGTASLLCTKCAVIRPHLDGVAPFGRETDTAFHYKRINHFREAIQLFQAKESTTITKEILTQIMVQLSRQGPMEVTTITKDGIRKALKELSQTNRQLRRYYENEAQIHFLLTGIAPPRLTSAQEDRICLRFFAIQEPFRKHRPPERKNFFSYSYLLYKISEMEGWVALLPHFRLHKGAEKRRFLDRIWKNICEELHGKDPTLPWWYKPTPAPERTRSERSRAPKRPANPLLD